MKQRLPAKRSSGWGGNLLTATGDVLVPLVFAFAVGSIFSLICGCNPFTLYGYIIKKAFFSLGGILNTLGYTTPIIITGIATALSIRANMYNMGIEGQVFLGWAETADGAVKYQPNDKLRMDASVTLYAVWGDTEGVLSLVYMPNGGTENAANILACRLREQGVQVEMFDTSVTPASYILAAAFRFSHVAARALRSALLPA